MWAQPSLLPGSRTPRSPQQPAAVGGCWGGAVLIWAGRQRKMQLCVSAFSELHTFKEAVLFQVEGMCR